MFCWFFRLVISDAADRGRDLGRIARRHLGRCATCCRFQEDCRWIEAGLRTQATRVAGRPGPTSPQAPAVDAVAGPQCRCATPARIGLSIAASVAVTAATVLVLRGRTEETPQPAARQETKLVPTGVLAELLERPLTTEVQNLASDTESGVRFLVACLDARPSGALGTQPGSPGPSHTR